MKLRAWTLAFALGLSLGAATGCDKTTDVSSMEKEATGIVKVYSQRFDELGRRAEALMTRANSLRTKPTNGEAASTLYTNTRRKLDLLRGQASRAPSEIATAAKSEDAYTKLGGLMGHYRTELGNGATEITTNLDAVESWIAYAELTPQQQGLPAANVPQHPDTPATQPKPGQDPAPSTTEPPSRESSGAVPAPPSPR